MFIYIHTQIKKSYDKIMNYRDLLNPMIVDFIKLLLRPINVLRKKTKYISNKQAKYIYIYIYVTR